MTNLLSQVPRELAERLFDLQEAGRIMHESWARTKHAQGFHGPNEPCTVDQASHSRSYGCGMYHADLIPWEELSQKQRDINLNAFKDVFAVLQPRAEAVIREAMQKALEAAVQVCEKAEFWRSDFDVSRPGIRAAIRSLSPAASAVTAGTKEYESNEQRQATPSQDADFTGNEDSSSAKAVPILQASDVSENNPTRSVDDYQEVPILSVRKEPDIPVRAMQRAQPQWISVEEKLPKQEVACRHGDATWTSSTWHLCVEWDDDMEEFGHVIASYSETKGWKAMGYTGPPNITHWMPLPEPPHIAASSLTEQETTE
jgi:hypothetical protein